MLKPASYTGTVHWNFRLTAMKQFSRVEEKNTRKILTTALFIFAKFFMLKS
jgi:hypothetical protein